MVGTSFLETSLVLPQTFFEAKEAGCRVVTVDPHFCTTARQSDEWVPIEPGTGRSKQRMVEEVIWTPTGRLEVYCETQLDYNQQLPSRENQLEVYEGNPLREKYPLRVQREHVMLPHARCVPHRRMDVAVQPCSRLHEPDWRGRARYFRP